MSESQLEQLTSAEEFFMLVIEEDRRILGFAVIRKEDAVARLITIDIDPEYRRVGLGTDLMVSVENEARRRGCEAMVLEARATNAPAIALYAKMGYKPLRVVPGYYFYPEQGSTDALEMGKRLL